MENNYVKIYRASAGSGKTYTLAVEYIAHLIGGMQWSQDEKRHRHILAITFTNKATAEMKERILSFLLELSRGENDKVARDICELKPIPKGQIAERARMAMLSIIHDYDNFHVRTIDTFFQRILSSLAHELGQSATFRVDINDDEVISDAVDLLLSKLDENKQVREWIHQYIRTRVNENESWRLPDEIKNFARTNVLSEAFQSSETELREISSDNKRIEAYRKKLYAMRQAALDRIKGLDHAAVDIENIISEQPSGTFYKGGKSITDHIHKVCGGDYKAPLGKTILKALYDPIELLNKSAKGNADPQIASKRISDVFTKFYESLQEQLYTINSCNLTLVNLNPLRLLGEISSAINEVNAEHNRLLLAQTKLIFHEMVRGEDAPFIFEKTGTKYHNILIDEFQDTARTQWDNLHKLLLDKAAAGEDTLIVGDVKQSIYRWNGGDWRILQNIAKCFNGGVEEKDLDVNYRSQQAIVLFNNTLFKIAAEKIDSIAKRDFCNTETDSIAALYKGVEQQMLKDENGGYVSLFIDTTSAKDFSPLQSEEELQPHNLAYQMIRLHDAGIPWEEMCILVRKNSDAQTLLEDFLAHQYPIPLISDEAFLLSSSQAVMLIIAALRFVVDKSDTVSQTYLARIYRNEILGEELSASELATGREALLPNEFTEHIEELSAMPLYELCLRLSGIFSLDILCQKPETQGQAAFLTSFLDEIVSFLADSNSPTIERFLEMWDKKTQRTAIPSSEANGVRIMTIHKAKGLAFHTVFVPFCQWDLVDSASKKNVIWWKIEDEKYNGLPLVPITADKTCANSIYARQYALECLQQMVDNLNLMYVAFTRPKQNLLIWANAHRGKDKDIDIIQGFVGKNAPIKNVGQLLHRVCEEFPNELQGKCSNGDETKKNVTVSSEENIFMNLEIGTLTVNRNECEETKSQQLKYSPRRSRAKFVQSSNAALFVGSEDDAIENIEHGLLYHRLFEEFHTSSDIEPAINHLSSEGIIPHSISLDELALYAHERIDGTRALPVVREWFNGNWTLHNEAAIIQRDPFGNLKTIRPDRVMEHDGKTIVVDYKFARPDEKHKTQVKNYIKTLLSMGKTDVQGYLWYVDRNEVQEVEC